MPNDNYNNYPQVNKSSIIPNNSSYNQNQNILIKDHHINNYGYFYIMPNNFMNLQSQQKIIINTNQAEFSGLRVILVMIFS